MVWVLDLLDELDADFRVFYRIDGIGDQEFGTLTARRFAALAERVFHYRGATYTAALRLSNPEASLTSEWPSAANSAGGTRVVESTPGVLQTDSVLAGLIEYS